MWFSLFVLHIAHTVGLELTIKFLRFLISSSLPVLQQTVNAWHTLLTMTTQVFQISVPMFLHHGVSFYTMDSKLNFILFCLDLWDFKLNFIMGSYSWHVIMLEISLDLQDVSYKVSDFSLLFFL